MKRLIAAALGGTLVATAATAEDVLREIAWGRLKQEGLLSAGDVRPADAEAAFERLVVANGPQPRTLTLLRLEAPGITRTRYALTGTIRCDGVEGKGYLEMWSDIPGKGSFFSRTLASQGPMAGLEGSSGWRPVVLPFDAAGGPPPSALTLNLVLPGRGTVHLGPLRLVQSGATEDPRAVEGAWWGPRTAGLAGAIMGSLIGCMGALIGVLAQKGRGRGLALGFLRTLLVLAAVALGSGMVAVLRSQPYEVFYPLLLCGVLGLGLPLYLLPVVRRRYEEVELRKLSARDLGTPMGVTRTRP
jgi:hypothetical protein